MENINKEPDKYVNTSTGEYIEVYEGDRIKVVRKQQEVAIKKTKERNKLNEDIQDFSKELGGFVFVLFKYSNHLLEEYPDITSEDITKLFYLATFVNYEGYLIFNKSYAKKSDIQNILNLSKSPYYMFYNKMIKLDIFIEDECGNVKINRAHFIKGKLDKEIKEYSDYTRVFVNTIKYLYENVPINKHKRLGNYFKMIPFIHRQQNALCWNPNSKAQDIKLMTLGELKEILGYSKNGIKAFKNELFETRLKDGRAIIGIFQTEKNELNSKIIINPMVFYGGNFKLSDIYENMNGRHELIKWF